MNINCANNTNLYFQGRCVQIRDSQWVIHTIKTKFPHTSTSLFKPVCNKWLGDRPLLPKENLSKNLIKNFIYEQEQYINKLKYIKNFQNKIDDIRSIYYDDIRKINIFQIIDLLKNSKIGNCMENAKMAELILKMNGIKNSFCAILTSKNYTVDHMVCAFNKDGSKFDGKIKNSTIIIDPWAQKTDFASNMLKYYKNMMHNHLCYLDFNGMITIDPEATLELKYHNELKLTQNQLTKLKKQYPELIFHSKNRNFMNL